MNHEIIFFYPIVKSNVLVHIYKYLRLNASFFSCYHLFEESIVKMEAEQTITLIVKITYEPFENREPVSFPITESFFNAIQYFV